MGKIFVKLNDGSYHRIDDSYIVKDSVKQIYKNGYPVAVSFSFKKEALEKEKEEFELKNRKYTYLISQKKFYKIGITKNLKKRFDGFETHNIDFKVVGYIIGDYEKELQSMFQKYHYKKEWFHKNKEILNEFKKRGMIKYQAINNFENGNRG